MTAPAIGVRFICERAYCCFKSRGWFGDSQIRGTTIDRLGFAKLNATRKCGMGIRLRIVAHTWKNMTEHLLVL